MSVKPAGTSGRGSGREAGLIEMPVGISRELLQAGVLSASRGLVAAISVSPSGRW